MGTKSRNRSQQKLKSLQTQERRGSMFLVAGVLSTVALTVSSAKGWFNDVPDAFVMMLYVAGLLPYIYYLLTHEKAKQWGIILLNKWHTHPKTTAFCVLVIFGAGVWLCRLGLNKYAHYRELVHMRKEQQDLIQAADNLEIGVITPTSSDLYKTQFTITNRSNFDITVHKMLCISSSILTYNNIEIGRDIAASVIQNDVLLTTGGEGQTRECLKALADLGGRVRVMGPIACADIVVEADYSLTSYPHDEQQKLKRFAVSPLTGDYTWASQSVNDDQSYCMQPPKQPPSQK